MHSIISISLSIAALIAGTLSATAKEDKNSVESALLDDLDSIIESKELYHTQFNASLETIKAEAAASGDLLYKSERYGELFKQYLHFQADSALHYVNVRQELASSIGSKELDSEITINRAEVMGVMGMYNETLQELEKINSQELSKELRGYYYRTYRAYWGWITDYTAESSAKHKYLQLTELYRDSVLLVETVDINRRMIEVEQLISQRKNQKAIEVLEALIPLTDDKKQLAYIYFNLSLIYSERGNKEKELYYLAQTARVDLKMATREYASLQRLAYVLYEMGDVDRAFKYLSCSMEDAVASNARLRFMEVALYYPIIDRAYRQKEVMQQATTRKLLLSVSIFAIILTTLTIYLYLSRKRLNAAREQLDKSNKSLQGANDRLCEIGRIKEVYIARYLERCVTYIDKLDNYRRSLKRLAQASKIEELNKALKSDQMLQSERKEFYAEFDNSFLILFPNFVSDFNLLLDPAEQMTLKGEGHLNTELRIFALIRLGITDASQIAHFLGYSLATVYSYRSKMRNRAICNKDQFEQIVMTL